MLARFLLVLLLAVGAAPAAAMPASCHGDPAMGAMVLPVAVPTPRPRQPQPAIVEHGCIGCATIADWLAERVLAPVATPDATPVADPVRLALRRAPPPSERPPRIG